MRKRITKEQKDSILDQALAHVKSVPYSVGLRWLFYRLLHNTIYKDKDDYNNLKSLLSKSRKEGYRGWDPNTLADETRQAIIRHGSYNSPQDWLEGIAEDSCYLDEWHYQPNYVEVWFEAKAMTDQFKHLTDHVTLVPFGGDASIPYKWAIAKRIEKCALKYGNPVKIVYFGDCDPKGNIIPGSALKDIRAWCSVPFEFIRGGLTLEQARKYELLEDPDRPGSFQWEALDDEAAKEIISETLAPFLDEDGFEKVRMIEDKADEAFNEKIHEIIDTIEFEDEV